MLVLNFLHDHMLDRASDQALHLAILLDHEMFYCVATVKKLWFTEGFYPIGVRVPNRYTYSCKDFFHSLSSRSLDVEIFI